MDDDDDDDDMDIKLDMPRTWARITTG